MLQGGHRGDVKQPPCLSVRGAAGVWHMCGRARLAREPECGSWLEPVRVFTVPTLVGGTRTTRDKPGGRLEPHRSRVSVSVDHTLELVVSRDRAVERAQK
jgi:hypothetical protein